MNKKFILFCVCIFVLMYCAVAWADEIKLSEATDEQKKNWADGNTYIADADLTIADRVAVSGTVTLILNDGCTLSADSSITVSSGNKLTITAPEASSGIGGWGDDGYRDAGTIIIEGGNITAAGGGSGGAGIGGSDSGAGGTAKRSTYRPARHSLSARTRRSRSRRAARWTTTAS